MTKDELSRLGRQRVLDVCAANGWNPPPYGGNVPGGGSCGLYTRGTIYVTPSACAGRGYGGAAWSWPGYVIDRTPYGVHAHEFGHYVDDRLRHTLPSHQWFSGVVRRASQEPKLTNYSVKTSEWFAEMMRLYVTNPDLLRLCRPVTYAAIARHVKLPPVQPWKSVLAGAPARTLAMAQRKITQGVLT